MGAPLDGVRVVELGALGPVPHAMMVLADLGADVVRVARPVSTVAHAFSDVQDATLRGRRQVRADLKDEAGRRLVLDLVAGADVLVEGFRPGVAERLGIGPHECHKVNPELVYARMTGWGQSGPLARAAGHDLNYLSLTGALHAMGRPGTPPPVPLNLIGDFGGGSMFLVTGILAALVGRRPAQSLCPVPGRISARRLVRAIARRRSALVAESRGRFGNAASVRARRRAPGRGCDTGSQDPVVLDVAMVDGIVALQQPLLSMRGSGTWTDERGANLIDGGAPFYDTYACSDGGFVAVGALEPAFFAQLVATLGLDPAAVGDQFDRAGWARLRTLLEETFMTRTRDEWASVFADVDACVTPVLDFAEAAQHPHLVARQTFAPGQAEISASPAPRFGGEGPLPLRGAVLDVEADDVLADWAGRR